MSFYRNYKSKEDIIQKRLQRLNQEWKTEFKAKDDEAYFAESLLRHYYNYKDFYLFLYRRGLSNILYESIREAVKMNEAADNMERCMKSMVAGSLWGWIDEWLRQGMPETPEEIILLSSQISKGQQDHS